ncbi:hypothetical protein TNCV_1179731 [Trichonephila clavipes]|nr:hypothetical protein TNCV_1179731 [Trichonephila clavipes]
MTRGGPTARYLLLALSLFVHFDKILKAAEHEQPTSYAVDSFRVFGPLQSALFQIRLDQSPFPSFTKLIIEFVLTHQMMFPVHNLLEMSATASNKCQTFWLPSITWAPYLVSRRRYLFPGSRSTTPLGVILKKKRLLA